MNSKVLITKMNAILDNANASFRVTEENIEEALSEILPMFVLEGNIISAYGVPTLNEIVSKVEKSIQS